MMLNKFLDKYTIDVDALSRIKHRLYVVGKFRPNEAKDAKTEVFLFTKRRDLSDAYSKNFTSVNELSYEQFVKVLKPAIAERVEPGNIPTIRQVVPSGDGTEESSSVIDTYNFFFWRAVANTTQPSFQVPESGLVKELLQDGDRDPGKGIFKIIRRNLGTFCSFQPMAPEIIEAFSQLLGSCGKEHDLPAYAAGDALPGGFPERLIDFLFAENTQDEFTLSGLDLTGEPWSALSRRDPKRAEKAEVTFVKVVTSFRDALHQSKYDQFAAMRFRGKPIGQQAKNVLKPELVREFGRARDAFNGLRQILRSKVLLSMVLEWVFKAYYELEPVRAIDSTNAVARDRKVRDIVLREYEHYGIAPAVKRASPAERRRFSKSLTANFESLLVAIVGDGEVAQRQLDALPPEIRSLAEEIRGNSDRRRLLVGVSGVDFGKDYQKAFLDAAKTMLLDVLCPTLYQSPVLSVQMLRKFFKQETMAAYLTAVFLDDKHQDAVREIAEQHLEFFQKNIDKETKTIQNTGAVQEKMLRDFIGLLAKPEIARRLNEELEVLKEMHTLLENTPLKEGQESGPGRISALRDSGGQRPAGESTPIPNAKIEEPVKEMAKRESEREIIKIEEAAAQATRTVAAGQSSAAVSESAAGAFVAAAATPATLASAGAGAAPADLSKAEAADDSQTDDELSRSIRDMTERIVAAATVAERRNPEAIAKKITGELLATPEFVERAKKDVQVFEKVLHLIYRRYVDNTDKKTFRNKVERMTLVNLMLLFQKELGLGKMCSNLHHMLLDLVEHVDPENPDAKAFIQEISLTKYFDNAVIEGKGVTDLRETLEAQAVINLDNTVDFVSELRGVKYLLDSLQGDSRAEVIVLNATAPEFLDWVTSDNFTGNEGASRLRAKMTTQEAETAIPPALVYFTDIAFPEGISKQTWLQQLGAQELKKKNVTVVLPPMCLSTGHQNRADWQDTARSLKAAAADVPAPVVIVGPSPYMNRKGDVFQTYLPAGYVFAAHVLSRPDQRIRNEQLIAESEGRFRVIGSSIGPMKESLDRVVWGAAPKDSYAFAVDFYLYLVLMLLATAGQTGSDPESDVYQYFYWTEKDLAHRQIWASSRAIERALLHDSKADWFSMQQNLSRPEGPGSKQMLTSVAVRRPEWLRTVTDVTWFNVARDKADLP